MGLPITNAKEKVFAAINSPKRKGKGEILAFLAKMQTGGVRVKIIMSLEVNMVSTATVKYKMKNSCFWFNLHFSNINFATKSKNPASPKNTDIEVIDIKSIKIFKGFTPSFTKKQSKTSFNETVLNNNKAIAPISATTQ